MQKPQFIWKLTRMCFGAPKANAAEQTMVGQNNTMEPTIFLVIDMDRKCSSI